MGVRFFIGVPIMLSPTVRVGTLCLMDTEPRNFYSLQDCHFAMQSTEEIAQCLGEASRTSAHFAITLDTLGTLPTLSTLPPMSCSSSTNSSPVSTPRDSPSSIKIGDVHCLRY